MMVVTAKVKKKNLLIVGTAILAILVLLLWPGKKDKTQEETPQAQPVTGNEARIKFLESFGWQVSQEPAEANRVRVPQEENEIFIRYNRLQQSQGYDLRQYAGKTVERYVYEILNGPQEGGTCKATVFVYKDEIIGGDISQGGPGGKMHGFRMP